MDQNEEIINRIRDIFIEMNKGAVSEDKIDMYFGKRQQFFLIELDHTYCCMIILKNTDELI